MKSVKVFVISIIALTIALLMLAWIRDSYYSGQVESPLIKVRTFMVLIAAIIIMKISFTVKGFKICLIAYFALWIIYFSLNIAAKHFQTLNEVVDFYKEIIPLETPLPLIFFWVLDRVFFIEKKNSTTSPN